MKMKFNINLNSKHLHIILTYIIKSLLYLKNFIDTQVTCLYW